MNSMPRWTIEIVSCNRLLMTKNSRIYKTFTVTVWNYLYKIHNISLELTSFIGIRSFKISAYLRNTSMGAWILVKWLFSTHSRSSSSSSVMRFFSKISRFIEFKSSCTSSSSGFETSTKSIDRTPSLKNSEFCWPSKSPCGFGKSSRQPVLMEIPCWKHSSLLKLLVKVSFRLPFAKFSWSFKRNPIWRFTVFSVGSILWKITFFFEILSSPHFRWFLLCVIIKLTFLVLIPNS